MSASGGRLLEMLVEHGIPERAARIYLAACREGPQTAAELARITALNRVEAYRFIRHLEVLGLLRATHKRPMRFEPLPPAELIDRWIRGASERLRRLEVDREAALADASEGLLDVESADPRKFAVLEGDAPIARFMVRRIGTARSGIDGVVPASSLPFLTEGGIDRALKDAHARGVRVRITTEVTLANRSEARSLGSFAEVRHSHRPVAHQSWTIDRQGALLYLAAAESLRGPPATRVALWTSAPSVRRGAVDHFRHLWSRASPADARLVELEGPGDASLPVSARGDLEPFARLREVAALGMKATGLSGLGLQFPDAIETIGRQLGRQIGRELDGETAVEIARSLVQFYKARSPGRLEVVRENPLSLRIGQCFACLPQTPEVGRVLCPSILQAALESRLGDPFEVSRPDPSRHAARGCLFSVKSS